MNVCTGIRSNGGGGGGEVFDDNENHNLYAVDFHEIDVVVFVVRMWSNVTFSLSLDKNSLSVKPKMEAS